MCHAHGPARNGAVLLLERPGLLAAHSSLTVSLPVSHVLVLSLENEFQRNVSFALHVYMLMMPLIDAVIGCLNIATNANDMYM